MEESGKEFEIQLVERLLKFGTETDEDDLKKSDKKERPISDGGVVPAEEIKAELAVFEIVDEKTEVSNPEESIPSKGVFAKIEKSLASIGFFTPSSRRLKEQKVKTITFTRELNGQRVEVIAQIVPSALYGLPITADQDKYIALQRIITTRLQAEGKITNPIRFKSAELLKLLGRNTDAGKNYKEISDWLDVMTATMINSKGVVYRAEQKKMVTDRFHVFDRAVSFGKEMDDGSIADANYVWLSEWQLQNINHSFLLPIDIETYRELKNHIAKALVPMLQIWLFATQKTGSFEKRYEELCEVLNIQTFRRPSEIIRQLKPSLDELTRFEYIASWRIEKTKDQKAFKIVFAHGAKFHRDRRTRIGQRKHSEPSVVVGEYEPLDSELPKQGRLEKSEPIQSESKPAVSNVDVDGSGEGKSTLPVLSPMDEALLAELVGRGIMQSAAVEILRSLPDERKENVGDYVDYWDSLRPDATRGKGPGLLLHLIEKNDPLPPTFETRRQRADRRRLDERRQKLRLLKETIEFKYGEFRLATIDRFVAEAFPPAEFERRVAEYKERDSQQSALWGGTIRPELQDNLARQAIKLEIGKELNILSLEDFRKRELPAILTELQLNAAELGIDLPTGEMTNPPAV